MEKVLTTFKRIKAYTDKNAPGRDWNLATAMVIKGEAGMQFMGDWAKGEFLAANKVPGKDFGCVAAPGTAKAYTYNVDSFALFKLKDAGQPEGAAGPRRGHHVDRVPGSVQPQQGLDPGAAEHEAGQVRRVRQDLGRRLRRDVEGRRAGPVDRPRHGVPSAAEGALKDVVSQFWNDDKATPAATMDKLVAAAAKSDAS